MTVFGIKVKAVAITEEFPLMNEVGSDVVNLKQDVNFKAAKFCGIRN